MIKKRELICVISARGGSKGIKNKNILNFHGKPLIAWSILQATKSKCFKDVFISTDSLKIANISKKYGAKVVFLRSKKLSGSKVSKFYVWKDALEKIEKFLNRKIKYFFDLDCTNPIRDLSDIRNILKMMKENKKIDGVITVAESRKNPYFNMLELNKNGYLKVSKKLKKWPVGRQFAPKVLEQVANLYCFRTSFLRENNHIYDGKIKGYSVPTYKSYDIDSYDDLGILDIIFKKRKLNNVRY